MDTTQYGSGSLPLGSTREARLGPAPQHQLHAGPDPGPDVGEGQRIAVPADQPAQFGGGEVDRLLDLGQRQAALAGPQGGALDSDAARGQPRGRSAGWPAAASRTAARRASRVPPRRIPGRAAPTRPPRPGTTTTASATARGSRPRPAGLVGRGGHHRTRVAFLSRCDHRWAEPSTRRRRTGPGPSTGAADRCRCSGCTRTRRCPVTPLDGDAGADLCTMVDVRLQPGERALLPTGLAIALPAGYAGFVQPRSGLAWRAGLGLVNAPGTIDSGYRGEIKVIVVNHDRDKAVELRRGDRIAQLVIQRVERARFERGGTAARVRPRRGRARLDRGSGGAGGRDALPVRRTTEETISNGASAQGKAHRAVQARCHPAVGDQAAARDRADHRALRRRRQPRPTASGWTWARCGCRSTWAWRSGSRWARTARWSA